MKPLISELEEDEHGFYVRSNKNNFPLISISNIGTVLINYPIDGGIDPSGMKGFYISEKKEGLELMIHFMGDREWSIGRIDPNLADEARKWVEKVNGFYRKD